MLRVALVLALVLALAAPAAAKNLVTFHRSGGLAGVDVSLRVSTGGTARVSDARTGIRRYSLTQRRLRALRQRLKEARFSTLSPRYLADGSVADGFVETVTYRGRSVTVETGGHPPKRLRRLLEYLGGLVAGG